MMGAPVRPFIRPPKKGQYERLKKRKSINLVGLVLSQLLSLYRMSLYFAKDTGELPENVSWGEGIIGTTAKQLVQILFANVTTCPGGCVNPSMQLVVFAVS